MITQVAGPSNIYFIISSLKTRSKSIYILHSGEDNEILMEIISQWRGKDSKYIKCSKNIITKVAKLSFFES